MSGTAKLVALLTAFASFAPLSTHGLSQNPGPRGQTRVVTAVPYKKGSVYKLGEVEGWTLAVPEGTVATEPYTFTVKKNNFEIVKSGNLDLSTGKATIELTATDPGCSICK